jgi:hypothetical protein
MSRRGKSTEGFMKVRGILATAALAVWLIPGALADKYDHLGAWR